MQLSLAKQLSLSLAPASTLAPPLLRQNPPLELPHLLPAPRHKLLLLARVLHVKHQPNDLVMPAPIPLLAIREPRQLVFLPLRQHRRNREDGVGVVGA